MPGVAVAGVCYFDASIAVVDGEVEGCYAVATGGIGASIARSASGASIGKWRRTLTWYFQVQPPNTWRRKSAKV